MIWADADRRVYSADGKQYFEYANIAFLYCDIGIQINYSVFQIECQKTRL